MPSETISNREAVQMMARCKEEIKNLRAQILLMRAKHKVELANLLDIISAELRAAGEADADAEGGDPTSTELLKPNGNNGVVNAEICELALLLVGDVRVSLETVETWSADQQAQAYDWAMRVHLQASDNDDVIVPPRPAFISARSTSSDS